MANDLQEISIKERYYTIAVFTLVLILTTFDVIEDMKEGVKATHLSIELGIILACGLGSFILLAKFFNKKKQISILNQHIENQNEEILGHKEKADYWKRESSKFIEGLGIVINRQMELWKLSPSEKDVALFLLKGLTLKEVAEIRTTSEKTVRHQATSIYKKSELNGRQELSAFFLEDLLIPQEVNNPQ